ncbi:MAG: hypothetical protein KJO54_11920 [Gammaproteobacteria bacterium]|nr:hypothetical protein [Gammaproteobacteria bacterium]NNF62211.1 hypothetical protein [Gammaproteobacteria bacterium]NNM20576.1 hypothetical protein [Gammaproteobacteria bacterium]
MKYPLVVVAIALLSGCASNGPLVNVGTHTAQIQVPPRAAVRVEAAIGEIVIQGGPTQLVDAHVELMCREGDRGCERRAEKVQVISRADTSAVIIALQPDSMMAWHDIQARVNITAPDDRALFLKIGAGDIDVRDMRNCVELDMYAGDATIYIQRDVVGSVSLDTGTGDANLVIDGKTIHGRRALLVGAELEWSGDGSGWCQVYGDLQFGDLTVHLK